MGETILTKMNCLLARKRKDNDTLLRTTPL